MLPSEQQYLLISVCCVVQRPKPSKLKKLLNTRELDVFYQLSRRLMLVTDRVKWCPFLQEHVRQQLGILLACRVIWFLLGKCEMLH